MKRLGLGGRELPDVSFVVAGHEAVPGAIGFLGQNILGATDTEYDLANGVIRLMQPKGCGKADLAYWVKEGPYSVMPLGQAAPGRAAAGGDGHHQWRSCPCLVQDDGLAFRR